MKDATSLRRVRIGDVDDLQAVRKPGDRNFGAADVLAELMQAGVVVLRRAVFLGDLEARERDRRVSSVISTIHRNDGDAGREPNHVLVGDQHDAAAAHQERHGKAVWVGHGNGGLQSRPEMNFGLLMSSMSRMTKPPCQ